MLKEQLSEKVKKYIEKVEKETNRRISIVVEKKLNIPGPSHFLFSDNEYIVIQILPRTEKKIYSYSKSIAHEITHAYLHYKLNFFHPNNNSMELKNENYIFSMSLALTLIDDIVVNKILDDEGIIPYDSHYFFNVRKEIIALENGDQLWSEFSSNHILWQRWIVLRCVIAWAAMTYHKLNYFQRQKIKKFLYLISINLPEIYNEFEQIKQIIQTHDIFKKDGNKDALFLLFELWKINF